MEISREKQKRHFFFRRFYDILGDSRRLQYLRSFNTLKEFLGRGDNPGALNGFNFNFNHMRKRILNKVLRTKKDCGSRTGTSRPFGQSVGRSGIYFRKTISCNKLKRT